VLEDRIKVMACNVMFVYFVTHIAAHRRKGGILTSYENFYMLLKQMVQFIYTLMFDICYAL